MGAIFFLKPRAGGDISGKKTFIFFFVGGHFLGFFAFNWRWGGGGLKLVSLQKIPQGGNPFNFAFFPQFLKLFLFIFCFSLGFFFLIFTGF